MNIISWNVSGLSAVAKKGFFESIELMKPDILCLQETKASVIKTKQILNKLNKYHLFCNSAEKKGYAGTALLSKIKPISSTYTFNKNEQYTAGRLICAEFENFFLINVYVPNSGRLLKNLNDRKIWDTHFFNYVKKLKSIKPVIICGDLNVAHQSIDLKNNKANYNKTAGYTQIEIDGMTKLLSLGFIDTYRYLYPNKIAYSYWSYRFNARLKNIGWRIDYVLVDTTLANKVINAIIYSNIEGSDHCPVGIELNLD